MRIVLFFMLLLSLTGCVSMTGIEHTVYGGMSTSESRSRTQALYPSGTEQEGRGYNVGMAVKTIWSVK